MKHKIHPGEISICREKYQLLRYANDITLTAKSKELKSLLMKVKGERKLA